MNYVVGQIPECPSNVGCVSMHEGWIANSGGHGYLLAQAAPPERPERGVWPLLTVETEVNGDSKSTNERGPFLGWFVGLVVSVQEIFVLPWLL